MCVGPMVLGSDQILCLIVLEISGFSPFSKAVTLENGHNFL